MRVGKVLPVDSVQGALVSALAPASPALASGCCLPSSPGHPGQLISCHLAYWIKYLMQDVPACTPLSQRLST